MSTPTNPPSPGSADPTYADFVTMQQEILDLFDRGQRESRKQIERSSRELREIARKDRAELLTAIAEGNAALRADMHRDFVRVEARIESLTVKTDNNDRQILRMQAIGSVLVGAALFAATVAGVIAAFD